MRVAGKNAGAEKTYTHIRVSAIVRAGGVGESGGMSGVEYIRLGPGEAGRLARVAPDVFDNAIDPAAAAAYLANPDNVLIVARETGAGDGDDEGCVVGFVSATRTIHPDKPEGEMFVNELSTAPGWRRRGIATALMRHLFGTARELGCAVAWLAVDPDNAAALAFYRSLGGAAPEPQLHIDFRL
jgi:ribosomal protein S18 acetylase RimI-like enzyme